MKSDARIAALDVLKILHRTKGVQGIPEAMTASRYMNGLELRDKSLAGEIVYGVMRYNLLLDYVAGHYSKSGRVPRQPLLDILRIGLYQILFLDRIPSHAAVNEAVRLTHEYGYTKQAGYINAVLRKAAAVSLEDIPLPDPHRDFERHLSIKTSHPLWMVSQILGQYGPEKGREILLSSNKPAPLTIRVNSLKINRDELLNWLEEHHSDCQIEPGRYSPDALHIKGFSVNSSWRPLKEGWVYIQDEASQLVALFADPGSAERVLDLCAAPGGKTTHIAALSRDAVPIIALDRDGKRLDILKENCERLGMKNIRCLANSRNNRMDIAGQGLVSLILVDAPCSGFGTLRRHPDYKWNKTLDDCKKITRLQMNLLEEAAELLSPGGILLYSTCTILSRENEDLIERFLKAHPEFLVDREIGLLNNEARQLINEKGYLISLPSETGMDGFFAVRLKKKRDIFPLAAILLPHHQGMKYPTPEIAPVTSLRD